MKSLKDSTSFLYWMRRFWGRRVKGAEGPNARRRMRDGGFGRR
jgi:hypothetical protein